MVTAELSLGSLWFLFGVVLVGALWFGVFKVDASVHLRPQATLLLPD